MNYQSFIWFTRSPLAHIAGAAKIRTRTHREAGDYEMVSLCGRKSKGMIHRRTIKEMANSGYELCQVCLSKIPQDKRK